MKISIIIPTYNRNEMLCKTISCILLFKRQFNELIIVDQTKEHEPETKHFLDEQIKCGNIKYIHIDFPNLPNARNVGLNACMGDIIIFFDDDVEINENTIPSHISSFSQPETGCVTGKVNVVNTNADSNIVFQNTSNFKILIKKILFFFLRKKASYVGRLGILSNFSCDKTLFADTCIGCNMSFRKEAVIKSGCFDVNYTGNAIREDTDMSVRLRQNGYKIIYNPSALINHYMDNSGGTRTAANESYWHTIFKNQCYFYLKNFTYSYNYIKLLQTFDINRCKKTKLNAINIFKKSYSDAKLLLG